MTREEAIAYGKRVIDLGLNDETQAFCTLAISALSENNVLDKIRAEIIQMPTISFNANDIYKADVLAIIDKCKVESEDKE